MTDAPHHRRNKAARLVLPGIAFVFSISLYIAILPDSILPGDSGELIAASHTLSVAHPPGYPLYLMLTRLFASAVHWGSVAYRYNLFSAAVAALTVSLLYLTLREIGIRRWVGLVIALALATQQAFWFQAAATEVYSLNAFFTVALLLTGVSARRHGENSFLMLAYLGGLAVSHHLTMAYALVGALLYPVLFFRIIPRPKTIIACVFLGLLGLTTWLYIPIRANLAPPFTWGATDTLSGFVSHITASRYAWRLKTFDLASRMGDFWRFFSLITSEFGIPLVGLAVAGIALNARKLALVSGALAVVVLSAVHFAAYNIPDIEGHILPALIGIAVLAGIGVEKVLSGLGKRSRALCTVATIAVFAIPSVNLLTLSPRKDQWLAYDYAQAIARSARQACGPSPVVVTATDLAGLSLAYISYVEESDVTLYIQGISHPSVIGSSVPPRSIDEALDTASRRFGRSRLSVLGGIEAEALGQRTYVCGMVSVPDTGSHACSPPDDYTLRGIGAEPRDFFSRALSAEYYLHLARWHIRRREPEEAAAYLEKATDLARGDAQTYVDASRLYLEIERHDEAEHLLRQAVDAEPTHFFAHFALANLLQLDGRIDEAVGEYNLALRGNPQPAPVHVNLGNIDLTEGRYAEAMAHYRQAVALDSSNVLALLGMAAALESAGRPEESIAYLNRAIRSGPGQTAAYHAKGSLLMKAGRYEEARETLESGLGLSPDDPVLLSDMGLYCLRTGRPDSAVTYLEHALEIRPDLLTARGNLAVAYEREGMLPQAIEQYRKYADQAPPGPQKQAAERALKELGNTQ
jgi:tetratricopeptide (TPR) repeat protein